MRLSFGTIVRDEALTHAMRVEVLGNSEMTNREVCLMTIILNFLHYYEYFQLAHASEDLESLSP